MTTPPSQPPAATATLCAEQHGPDIEALAFALWASSFISGGVTLPKERYEWCVQKWADPDSDGREGFIAFGEQVRELLARQGYVLLSLAEVETANGWYWFKVDTRAGTDAEDDALYGRLFDAIDRDESALASTPLPAKEGA